MKRPAPIARAAVSCPGTVAAYVAPGLTRYAHR
jgi:hypothetical protein